MFKKITKNIYTFISQNMGSNCYLIKDKIPTLIDSSIAENSTNIEFSLREVGLDFDKIKLILHTHSHADHSGCSALFKNAEKAMHRADAIPGIDRFLKNNEVINLGNTKLEVIHTPGHTQGSVCFFAQKEGILFSGDTIFASGCGRTDLPSGSAQQLLKSLKKLQKLPFSTLLPGHGPILEGKEVNRKNLLNLIYIFQE